MNAAIHLDRAALLIEQGRWDRAADELKQALAHDPDNARAHSLLALCWSQDKDQLRAATREAESGVGLAPDDDFAHYALAVVLDKRNHFPEARAAVDQAIALMPESATYFGLKASLFAQQQQWTEALEEAERGLSFDPDSETCQSYRALALSKLDRGEGAIEQAERQVSRRPDSSQAHATRGWALLHDGRYREAEEAFREALRLGPTNEMARAGMIQALNNHHLLFRAMFGFYTLVGRMSQTGQWALVIGLFVGMRVLRGAADANPSLEPYVFPVTVLYMAFCLLSWIINPLFNTFLRFHPFGKYLLSDNEKWTSNFVAALLLAGTAGAITQAVRGDYGGAILMFILPVFLTLPISKIFTVDEGWPRSTCIGFSVVLGLAAGATMVLLVTDGPWSGPMSLYGLGILAFSFLGNHLARVTVRR